MSLFRSLNAVAALSGFCLAGCTASAVPAELREVSVAGLTPLSGALTEALHQQLPDLSFKVLENGLAVANIERLQQGTADLGLTFADVAYTGYVGRLDGHPQPLDRLRGIAVLQLAPTQLVVAPGSAIRGLADLCGARVGVGVPGSGTSLTAALLLTATDTCAGGVVEKSMPYSEAGKELAAGNIDAMFVNQGYPADVVALVAEAGARVVDLAGPAIDSLRRTYPFLRPMVIPPNTYAGQTSAIHTIGVDTLFVSRADFDETLVYDVTRALFASLPELSSQVAALRHMDIERTAAMPIPLHEGAARYYRERALSR